MSLSLTSMPISLFAQFLSMLLKKYPFVISFSPLLLALFCHCSTGTQFTVGDSSGWGIPPYPSYYTNWSQSQFFRAGDSLEFNFEAKFYNLVEVSQYEYEHCSSSDVVKLFNNSPAIVPLSERGVFFFICNISNYCCLGQKIAITVHDSSPSPSPSPSLPPLATSPSLPPSGTCCTGATSPSSPPSGSAISPMPSPSGHSPEPSISYGENSMALSSLPPRSFTNLFSFLAFLVI